MLMKGMGEIEGLARVVYSPVYKALKTFGGLGPGGLIDVTWSRVDQGKSDQERVLESAELSRIERFQELRGFRYLEHQCSDISKDESY